jgi:tetratricopeptide (TPR) repeat protein
MKWMRVVLLGLLLFLTGYGGVASSQTQTPIDQMPMYGGMNRSDYPELRAADETFIQGVTSKFGSRERASDVFVNYAFQLYRKDDLSRAMARFNQAWLLNPSNPQVFWGFASVLHDRGDYCQSIDMLERALELGISPGRGFLADAGVVASRCALASKALTPTQKRDMLVRSEELFARAEAEDPNKAYVYGSWARAYRDQERYPDAWRMIGKQRASGGKPDEKFLSLLRAEFPEPTQK